MKKLGSLLSLLLFSGFAMASHVPGGNVTYECVGPNQYLVTLTLFEDCGTAFTGSTNQNITISNDCGLTNPSGSLPNTVYQQEISQLCPSAMGQSECNGGNLPGIYMHQWQAVITLPGPCDSWTFGYSSCCMNTTTNVSGQPGYYWEAVLNSQTAPCNNSPIITNPAVPYVCVGQAVCYSLGVIEADGNTLVYSLIDAQSNQGTNITYAGGYSGAVPIPGITIDPVTGQINFTPGTQGNFVVTVLIEEYDGNGNLVGHVIHQLQFEVINCNNQILDCNSSGVITNLTGSAFQIGPNTVQMCEGDSFTFDIQYDDPDNQDSLTFVSNIAAVLPGSIVSFNYPGAPADYSTINITISWTPPPGSSNWNTSFSITMNDNACPVSGQQTFVYNVDVVGATSAGPDQTICGNQQAQLQAINGTVFNWVSISGDPIIVGTNFSCNPCDNPIATPTQTTVYEVTSNLSGNCDNVDTVVINVVPDFQYTMSQGTQSTCLYDPIQLMANVSTPGAFTFNWYPTTFLSDSSVFDPVATITTPGTYTYYVDITNSGGCVKTDSVTITIQSAVSPVIDATTDMDTVCNQTAQLDVWFDTTVTSAGIQDNFDGGSNPIMWDQISNGVPTGPGGGCGTQTGTGDALYFDSQNGDRKATTVAFNAAPCTTIDFCLFIGNSSSTPAPCENADLNENVELQYSTNNGATWTTIQVFLTADWDPGGPYANSWACFSLPIPVGAQTGNTMFQWIQPQYSACQGCDNWALDDVAINCASQSTYDFVWTGSPISNTLIQDPTANPINGTWYYVTVTDSANGCTATDSVYIETCPPCPAPTSIVTDVSCPGANNGAIVSTQVGNTGPGWLFEWYDSGGNLLQTTNSLSGIDSLINLPPDTYTLSLTDSAGCTRDTDIVVVEPVTIDVTLNDTTICLDGTATLAANAVGGNGGPYVFNWTDQTTGLPAGQGAPTVQPTVTTVYELLVDDVNGCTSTMSTLTVTVMDSLTATIVAPITGVCPGEFVNLDATALGGNGGPYNFTWDDGTGPISTTNAVTVTPLNPTTNYCVTLQDGCETPAVTECVVVTVFPIPAVQFSADRVDGCFPVTINFTNDSDPLLSAQCLWDFGDGTTSTDCNPTHIYSVPGTYDVTLTITTPDGCIVDSTATAMINIYDYPVAGFSFGPQPTTFFDPDITFSDESSDAIQWDWDFDGLGNSTAQDPMFSFPNNNPGEYVVTLTVTNADGCTDSTTGTVIIDGIFTLYVPNAFSPDGDGINDVLLPLGEGIDETDYEFIVFTRWGQQIFRTTAWGTEWDGSVNGFAVDTKEDVYVWKIRTADKFTGEKKEYVGHVTVLR